jgi:hypothetical protein
VTMNRFSLPKVSRYYERRRAGVAARSARGHGADAPVEDEVSPPVKIGIDEGDGNE